MPPVNPESGLSFTPEEERIYRLYEAYRNPPSERIEEEPLVLQEARSFPRGYFRTFEEFMEFVRSREASEKALGQKAETAKEGISQQLQSGGTADVGNVAKRQAEELQESRELPELPSEIPETGTALGIPAPPTPVSPKPAVASPLTHSDKIERAAHIASNPPKPQKPVKPSPTPAPPEPTFALTRTPSSPTEAPTEGPREFRVSGITIQGKREVVPVQAKNEQEAEHKARTELRMVDVYSIPHEASNREMWADIAASPRTGAPPSPGPTVSPSAPPSPTPPTGATAPTPPSKPETEEEKPLLPPEATFGEDILEKMLLALQELERLAKKDRDDREKKKDKEKETQRKEPGFLSQLEETLLGRTPRTTLGRFAHRLISTQQRVRRGIGKHFERFRNLRGRIRTGPKSPPGGGKPPSPPKGKPPTGGKPPVPGGGAAIAEGGEAAEGAALGEVIGAEALVPGVGIAVAALTLLTVGLVEAAEAAYDFAKEHEESVRRLAQFGPAQAAGIGILDAHRQIRDIKTATETGMTSLAYTESLDRLEDRLQPIQSVLENIKNVLASEILDFFSELIAPLSEMAAALSELVGFVKDTPKPRWTELKELSDKAIRGKDPRWPGS